MLMLSQAPLSKCVWWSRCPCTPLGVEQLGKLALMTAISMPPPAR